MFSYHHHYSWCYNNTIDRYCCHHNNHYFVPQGISPGGSVPVLTALMHSKPLAGIVARVMDAIAWEDIPWEDLYTYMVFIVKGESVWINFTFLECTFNLFIIHRNYQWINRTDLAGIDTCKTIHRWNDDDDEIKKKINIKKTTNNIDTRHTILLPLVSSESSSPQSSVIHPNLSATLRAEVVDIFQDANTAWNQKAAPVIFTQILWNSWHKQGYGNTITCEIFQQARSNDLCIYCDLAYTIL